MGDFAGVAQDEEPRCEDCGHRWGDCDDACCTDTHEETPDD